MDHQGGISPVVDNQMGNAAVGPYQSLFAAPPIIGKSLAFQAKTPRSGLGNGSGGMGLGGKILQDDHDIGPKFVKGLDQHGCLNGHMQTAGNPQPRQWFLLTVFLSHSHQPASRLQRDPFPCGPSQPDRDRPHETATQIQILKTHVHTSHI
jgi:hypothetical protein